MTTVRHPLTPDRKYWPLVARELFEERAAIIQADTGYSKEQSERHAEAVVRRAWSMSIEVPSEW
jgi:hypothetical protein